MLIYYATSVCRLKLLVYEALSYSSMRPLFLYLLTTQPDTHATADATAGGGGGGGSGGEEVGAGAASFSSTSLGLSKEGLLAKPYLLQPIFAHEDTSERVSDRARDSQPHKHTHTHTHTFRSTKVQVQGPPPIFTSDCARRAPQGVHTPRNRAISQQAL